MADEEYDPQYWITLGGTLGYKDESLRTFLVEQEDKFMERKRAAEEREQRLLEREERAATREHEVVLLREETRLAEARAKATPAPQPAQSAPRPKLPKFEESCDDIDAYLERFERFATSQKWDVATWSFSLSPLLTGKALEVYSSLPIDDANTYDKLKTAILRRYQLTEEGFRLKFRNTRPDRFDTAKQFGAKLKRYFTRWIELSPAEMDYEGLFDLCLCEQFMSQCDQELGVFLRERSPKDFEDMIALAETYIQAHGNTMVKSRPSVKQRMPQPTAPPSRPIDQSPRAITTDSKSCFYCYKEGHLKRDCPRLKAVREKYGSRNQPLSTPKFGAAAINSRPHKDKPLSPIEAEEITKENTKDGHLLLANGSKVPYVGALCNNRAKLESLPICSGYIGDQTVEVLRD